MEKAPLISVITTVYNTEKYVEKCFDSIMEQTYPNIEFIIVDNGSDGNIQEIVKQYQNAYPSKLIKLKVYKENQGVFNARIGGAEISTGDYIAFIDSDDYVSIDFYRSLVNRAETSGADMVAADFVFEGENEFKYYHNFNGIRSVNFKYYNEEIRNFFFKQKGLAFYWNLVWNKIYSRALWNRAYPHLKKNRKRIVMCDDMGLSCVLYCFATHYENIHDVYYYYLRVGTGSSVGGRSVEKFTSILQDVENVFEFMENFIIENFPDLLDAFYTWKKLYSKVWCREVATAELSHASQKFLFSRIKQIFGIEKIISTTPEDDFFYSKVTAHSDELENIRKQIVAPKTEVVSFDIFDTLIMRPLWEPRDLFDLVAIISKDILPNHIRNIFGQLRVEADRLARKHALTIYDSRRDVTFYEIYSELQKLTGLSADIIDRIMQTEIDLELTLCTPRNTGKMLYDLAINAKKKVICVTDMYLPHKVIEKILLNNGYTNISKIYISSEYRTPKCDGLFNFMLKDFSNIKAENILHIGDNYYVDVVIPAEKGIRSFHMTKATEMFQNMNGTWYGGNSFFKIYQGGVPQNTDEQALWFLRNRCMIALVAKKMFDNPWVSINPESDFNGDPYLIGYYILGFFIDAIVHWLIDQTSGKYESIQFVARDGYVIKQAYDIYIKHNAFINLPSSNYLYVSRKALLPLMVSNAEALMNIPSFDSLEKLSPRSVLSSLKPIISDEAYSKREKICKENGCNYDDSFKSLHDWKCFVQICIDRFFDSRKAKLYREKMKIALQKQLSGKTCSFDIGYSGRTELVLSNTLEKPIDAYYIYQRKGRAQKSAEAGQFKITSFYDYLPSEIDSMIIETLLSFCGPSCLQLLPSDNNDLIPIFDSEKVNFQTEYVIQIMQHAALDFVEDICILEDCIGSLQEFSLYESVRPFNFYLHYSTPFDRAIFSTTKFKNGLFNEEISLSTAWDLNTAEYTKMDTSTSLYLNSYPQWKKFIILSLIDRKKLKNMAATKLIDHPLLLSFLRKNYKFLRSIYHLFKG